MKIPQYDVFLGTFGVDATWLEAVDGVGNALDRMKFLAAEVPGPYFIFCQKTHRVMASMNTAKVAETRSAKSA
jgi:hypothetical protein